MFDIQLKNIDVEKIQKNNLYKVPESTKITFVEEHESSKETVGLNFDLKDRQFGIYATEYRAPEIRKGAKTTDILACVVDENDKQIYTLVADVKSNISSFSDNLLKGDALITVIKEVRDFTEQIESELLYKEGFLLYYKHAGYQEQCDKAIITKNFECQKFKEAAEALNSVLYDDNVSLTSLKMKTLLLPYRGEEVRLHKFSEKKLLINDAESELKVYILESTGDKGEYNYDINLAI